MIQGTASSAGKSILVTALCRIFKQDGYSVAPFKSQNMALNSWVTREGGEIGRSQVVQAEAAGVEPVVDMNPVLLKPEADHKSQIVVLGKAVTTTSAKDYYRYTPNLLETVSGALERLRAKHDIILIEGAGSPAETNLREREIANMRIARLAKAPVLLVGDIDRGGVFASLLGTIELLNEEERAHVKAFIINKFRGDVTLLDPAIREIEARTDRSVLGVIPYFRNIAIAQEDSVYLDERGDRSGDGDLEVAIIRLPRISNYDDFDPLEWEGCRVRYVEYAEKLGSPDLVIIPGTKATLADLAWLRETGMAEAVLKAAGNCVPVIGICGGYQMLGTAIHDPDRVESSSGSERGLGLLDIVTRFSPEKSTTQVQATVSSGTGLLAGSAGLEITGYEIHMGQTGAGEDGLFRVVETPEGTPGYTDGTANGDGTVFGTYLHGLFHNNELRRNLLNVLRKKKGLPERTGAIDMEKDRQYDLLADVVREHLDMDSVYRILENGIV